uniref:Uncharacterized protein n=1 Tax=Syphacia muris TaxID=451379 RepID=A0A0N5AWM0_9BILA
MKGLNKGEGIEGRGGGGGEEEEEGTGRGTVQMTTARQQQQQPTLGHLTVGVHRQTVHFGRCPFAQPLTYLLTYLDPYSFV